MNFKTFQKNPVKIDVEILGEDIKETVHGRTIQTAGITPAACVKVAIG